MNSWYYNRLSLTGMCGTVFIEGNDDHPVFATMDGTKPDGSYPAIVGWEMSLNCAIFVQMYFCSISTYWTVLIRSTVEQKQHNSISTNCKLPVFFYKFKFF